MDDSQTKPDAGQSVSTDPIDRVSALLNMEVDGSPREAPQDEEREAQNDEADEELTEASDEDHPEEEELEEIELEGKQYRVPKAVKAAHMMHADYTRKTQELAATAKAEREAIQARAENSLKMVEFAQKYQQQIGFITAIDSELTQFDQQSLLRLRQEDPASYAQRVADLQLLQQHRANALQALQQVQGQHQAAFEQELQAVRASSQKELEKRVKGWDSKMEEQVVKYALDYGFPKAQVDQAVDWRQREIIWKAMQYDSLQKAKVTAQSKHAAPVVTARPGSSPGQQSNKSAVARQEAIARVKKTHSTDDAIAAMKGLL